MAIIKEVREIPLIDLDIGLGLVRLRNVGKEIDELADSIKKVGLLEPIVVREKETKGKYEIISGQRRFLAHHKLRMSTIFAGVLNEHVDDTTAKVLSLTENLIRCELETKDLIDACTYLYKSYGSIKAVVDKTGISKNKVSRYVKYDQLIDQLKSLVDNSEVNIQTALRAQEAAGASGEIDNKKAVELAKEMISMSGAQQSEIISNQNINPSLSSDELIENAKSGGRITQINVTINTQILCSLTSFAKLEGIDIDDAARILIQDGLNNKGHSKS